MDAMAWLSGKKTYILGGVMIVWGVLLYATGDEQGGMARISEGLGFIFLKNAIVKAGQ